MIIAVPVNTKRCMYFCGVCGGIPLIHLLLRRPEPSSTPPPPRLPGPHAPLSCLLPSTKPGPELPAWSWSQQPPLLLPMLLRQTPVWARTRATGYARELGQGYSTLHHIPPVSPILHDVFAARRHARPSCTHSTYTPAAVTYLTPIAPCLHRCIEGPCSRCQGI